MTAILPPAPVVKIGVRPSKYFAQVQLDSLASKASALCFRNGHLKNGQFMTIQKLDTILQSSGDWA